MIGGLVVAVVVMVIGLIWVGATGASATRVIRLPDIVPALGVGRAASVLDLGILLLFATPLAGVLVALGGFVRTGDRPFAIITVILLTLLIAGFVVALH